MARIYGVQLPQDKRIAYALAYLKGIGIKRAHDIVREAGINETRRTKDLTKEEEGAILKVISAKRYLIEGDLNKQVALHIARLRDIKCYRGLRHAKQLPVRGQRTKTNARTRKGPRKKGSQIALKRAVSKK
jgi:small subunit ribosomal protein S13